MGKHCSAGQATDDSTIRRMRFACWITKNRDKHSEYVILSVFAQQEWLSERARLFHLYAHCLFCYTKFYQQTIYM